jgi:hypothetical protein
MVIKKYHHRYSGDFNRFYEYYETKKSFELGSVQQIDNHSMYVLDVGSYSLKELNKKWKTMWSNIISGTSGIEIVSHPECGYINIL